MKALLRFAVGTPLALIMETSCLGQYYTRINLVSNTAGVARVTDPQLINPWVCLAVPVVRGGYPTKRQVSARCTTGPEPSNP
jgi:hypothetical protein